MKIVNMAKNFILLIASCLFCLFISELVLRIYNPFELRLRGNQIELPRNKTYIFEQNVSKRVKKTIIHTKNSLGFRGSNPPNKFDEHLTIIAVGGSTTECLFLTDNTDWPYILGKLLASHFNKIWINNTGLDGHSTYGHLVLLKSYIGKIKPKIAIFLIGMNDVNLNSKNDYDIEAAVEEKDAYIFKRVKCFVKNSYLLSLCGNLILGIRSNMKSIGHRNIDMLSANVNDYFIEKNKININAHNIMIDEDLSREILNAYINQNYFNYIKRLESIVKYCKQKGIRPIFITQPLLFGEGIDPETGINLETFYFDGGLNGKLRWKVLELYNDATRRVGREQGIIVVDLANKMPKSLAYFYDEAHYTEEGSILVADIIAKDLIPKLKILYNQYNKAN